ncbi:hypothetical protein [Intestinimonas butyriciproducens]|uniref:hypothetical protein n=1 Tax=Intestinimonas butyriciproducens TaxID=1297617 RepID=UPI00321948A7
MVKNIAAQGIAGTEMERFQHKSGQFCGQTPYPKQADFYAVSKQYICAKNSPV